MFQVATPLSLSPSLLTTLYKNPGLCASMQNISPDSPSLPAGAPLLHGGTNGQTVGGENIATI